MPPLPLRKAPRIPHLAPERRRQAVAGIPDKYGLSERHACRIVGQHLGTQRYVPTVLADEDELTRAIIALASEYDLARTGHVGCADLARVRNGEQVEVAGLVLMRQKPGSAKGTMFITLEDEGGVANLIVWPGLFERQRGLVLSAGLLSCRGRVRHQGRVTHVVAEHLTDLTFWLRRIGELDLGRLPNERGDVVRHGGSPDLRDARPRSAAGDGGRSSARGTSLSRIYISTGRRRMRTRAHRRSGCGRGIFDDRRRSH